jgi:hypothetical protein
MPELEQHRSDDDDDDRSRLTCGIARSEPPIERGSPRRYGGLCAVARRVGREEGYLDSWR